MARIEQSKQQKALLRLQARNRRDNLSTELRQTNNQAIQALLREMEIVRDSSTIVGYRSFGGEASVDDLLQEMIETGKRVYLPRVAPGRVLELCAVQNLREDFRVGAFGISEPTGEAILDLEGIDMVLTPGLAFDRRGGRIGFGAGYYDRLLQRISLQAVRVGIAFECQVIGEAPMEEWDQSMDWLVTEIGIWKI